MQAITQILSPKGIRFDCSGCANCCLQWPVPVSHEDYQRISKLDVCSGAKAELRSLRSSRESLIAFTHTLEKKSDGKCAYLNEEKRCLLHVEHGAAAKPSMCQLFPYTFMVTPDAVLAGLSFASSAVLYNTGTLLSEQADTLRRQFEIFQSLFKPKPELWQQTQLLDGVKLSWDQFKPIDQRLLQTIDSADSMSKKLKTATQTVLTELPDKQLAEREPRLEARPKIVDQLLLKHLEGLYFPEQVFQEDKYDFDARGMIKEITTAPDSVSFGQGKNVCKFADLIKTRLPKIQEVEDLFDRFLYVRFFSKMYFGPGFHHLSLLSGINHLRILHVLLRLKLKQLLCINTKAEIDFETAAEILRTLERRLTQLDLGKESQAVLEVMLASPSRQDRITFLSE